MKSNFPPKLTDAIRKSSLTGLLLLFACIFLLPQDSQYGGNLRIGLMADINTVYPWEMIDMETIYVLANIYEPLVRLRRDSADIEPGLAERIEPSNNYTKWTAYLRKNVKFHDGSVLQSDDVIASLSLHKDFPARISKIDDYTVAFVLDKPNAAFPYTLSIEYYSIAAPSTLQCYKKTCKEKVISGTGPFTFESWQPGKKITLKAFENYWDKKPYLNEVTFIPFNDNDKLMQALKNNTIHLTHGMLPKNVAELRKLPHVRFQSILAFIHSAINYCALQIS